MDYSGASEAEALIVVAGPAADGQLRGDVSSKAKVQNLSIGANKLAILTLSKKAHPEARVDGESVKIGKQTIRIENGKVLFGN